MDTQQLMAELRSKGHKITPQRIAICELILSSKDHPTADQVYRNVKKKYPSLSLATVYQALHLLTEMGLLQEVGFSNGVSRYDPNTSPHINIVCKACGKVQDYEAESVRAFWAKIVRGLGFKPVGQRLDVYRYCDRCLQS